ncbi:DUF4184 family protein [Viridibacterium curvum]|uniref:DUF4184 family protein n=1 Tax=Viridibacterium curvum TaxID=1101404 RepID=A0ABP9QRK3_9RHOO
MPFTVSHIAAVLPLRRTRHGQRLPITALIIGSMAPDFGFLIPGLDRSLSHSFSGLFAFSLPMGWLVCLLWRYVLQAPLLALLSRPLERRLYCVLGEEAPRSFLVTSAALLIGAASHVVWDAFTHFNGFGAQWIPLLTRPVATWSGFTLPWCDLFQHLSSLLGLLYVGAYACRWHTRSGPQEARDSLRRTLWGLALVCAPLAAGYAALLACLPPASIQAAAAWAAGLMLKTSALGILIYAACWHVQHFRRHSGGLRGAPRRV